MLIKTLPAIITATLISSININSAYAARIIDEPSTKAVNNVRWHKQTKLDPQTLITANIPANSANVFFIRPHSKDNVQTSANITINNRFQVSLQPGNYSQVNACSGITELSAEITGHKNNDLLRNALNFKLEPQTTYFFYVDVNPNGSTDIRHITKDSALNAMANMQTQTHQISRVVPDCPAPIEILTAPAAPIKTITNAIPNIQLQILFDTDKAIIKPQNFSEVQRVADFLTQYPTTTVTIEGHTDDRGSTEHNLKLSQNRVDAVKSMLIKNYHIAPDRLNSIGYGKSRPIASNATEEGRQQNRRVIAVFENNQIRP